MNTMGDTPQAYDIDIDRVAPSVRPSGPPRGYQRWLDLLFLHWPVPVQAMRALVPKDLELDLYDGHAWVGLVPFEMRGVRPRFAPKIAAFGFLETNVRTYVRHRGEPGVYFLSLEAASWIGVKLGRWGWGLPYFHADMSISVSNDTFDYASCRADQSKAELKVSYRRLEPMGPSEPGSPEFYFLERYLLFVSRSGRIQRGQVSHTPYPVHRAELISLEDTLVAAAGLEVSGPPVLVHASPGVDVEVFGLTTSPR